MAEVAHRDTYGIEDLGDGVLIRRRIMAGTKIPAHLKVEGAEPAEAAKPTSASGEDTDAGKGAKPATRPRGGRR